MPDKILNAKSLAKQKSRNKQRAIPKVEPEADKNIRLIKIGLPIVLAGFLWSYWSTLIELWEVWMRSDEYSSGLLVPVIAVYIIMNRRQQIFQCSENSLFPRIIGLLA